VGNERRVIDKTYYLSFISTYVKGFLVQGGTAREDLLSFLSDPTRTNKGNPFTSHPGLRSLSEA